jgi:hypothetical protein
MTASDYERSAGGRGEDFGADDRTWVDVCADDECSGRRHAGRGPKSWSRDDQQLYVEVCERLLNDRLIDARGIEVEVDNGVVRLRGQAAGSSDPALISRLVRETPGVKGLDMNVTVGQRQVTERTAPPPEEDDGVDKSSLSPPILAARAPPPDKAGAP